MILHNLTSPLLYLQQLKTTIDLVSDTDRNIHVMFEVLKRKKKAKVESLILNRSSFAQTIENLFALSFLVKDGRAQMYVEETGAQVVGNISCQLLIQKFPSFTLYCCLCVRSINFFWQFQEMVQVQKKSRME